jgi:hypothetical protein
LTGDECWGARGYALDDREARMYVIPPDLPLVMRGALDDARQSECASIYDNIVTRALAPCENEDWTDRKDYLYAYARLRRFVFSLGYYKELAVEIRRPFLTRAVLDVVRRLPVEMRVHKNAFVSMLKQWMPNTMNVPEQSVDSLPDWPYAVRARPEIRSFFQRHLSDTVVGEGILGSILDEAGFARIRDGFFDETVTPIERVPPGRVTRVKGWLKPLSQRNRTLDRIARRVRKENPRPPRTSFDFLRDVALLTLLEEELPKFGRIK